MSNTEEFAQDSRAWLGFAQDTRAWMRRRLAMVLGEAVRGSAAERARDLRVGTYDTLAGALCTAVAEPDSADEGAETLDLVRNTLDRVVGCGRPVRKDWLVSSLRSKLMVFTVRGEYAKAYGARLDRLWLYACGQEPYPPAAPGHALGDPLFYRAGCPPISEAMLVAVLQKIAAVGV